MFQIIINQFRQIFRNDKPSNYMTYSHSAGNLFVFVGWCLMPFQQYFSYIVAVSFIGEENRKTQRKPPTSRMSLTNFIT